MTDEVQQLESAAQQRSEFAVTVLRDLLQASAVGELETQKAVQRHFVQLGWKPRPILRHPSTIDTAAEFAASYEVDDRERLTVVAQRKHIENPTGSRGLVIWAHPDGMPFDGAAGWRHKPFAGVVEENRMYGWGIADDLSGVAALIVVAAILNDLNDEHTNVLLASTPSKGHASGILAALDGAENVDGGIYLHPAESGRGLHDIKAVAPGMLRFRLMVQGRQPDTKEPNHTLYALDAVDPIEPLMTLLRVLRSYNTRRARELGGDVPATMMIGTLKSGDSVSRMPVDCEAVVTFSMPPGASLPETQRSIESVVQEASDEVPWLQENPPAVEWLFGTTGVEVGPDAPLYQTVAGAVEDVCGFVPRHYGGHIASEIRQPMLNHGIPCVGLGPRSGSLTQAGASSDEWLDLDEYMRMISACTLAAIRWSRPEGP